VHAGDGVHGSPLQRVAQHLRLDRTAERDVETNAFLAAGADQRREALAERAVDERQCTAAHAVAHRHLHEAGGRSRADENGPRRAGQRAELGRDALQQLLHPG